MKKVFDEIQKLNLNDFCKSISDLTYQYVNKETKKPTEVPASHYKKLLQTTVEQQVQSEVQMQFIGVMYNQLKALRDEEPLLFTKALILLDLDIKPKEIGVKEQIALSLFNEEFERIASEHKKAKNDLHLTNEELINAFVDILQNKELQGAVLGISPEEPTDSKPADSELKS